MFWIFQLFNLQWIISQLWRTTSWQALFEHGQNNLYQRSKHSSVWMSCCVYCCVNTPLVIWFSCTKFREKTNQLANIWNLVKDLLWTNSLHFFVLHVSSFVWFEIWETRSETVHTHTHTVSVFQQKIKVKGGRQESRWLYLYYNLTIGSADLFRQK